MLLFMMTALSYALNLALKWKYERRIQIAHDTGVELWVFLLIYNCDNILFYVLKNLIST